MIPWWVGVALADEPVLPAADPPPAEVPAAIPADPVAESTPAPPEAYEVTVWGEAAIRDQRARVVRTFEGQGWRAKDRGDEVRFRGPRAWMGKGHLDVATGTFTWSQPVVVLYAATGQRLSDPVPGSPNLSTGGGLSLQFGIPSPRKVRGTQDRVFAEVASSLEAYRSVIAETEFRTRLAALPDRLDALWTTGAPLDEGAPLADAAARRAAVLAYWRSRADTPEGRAFARAVEAWVHATVQPSATPFTDAEVAASPDAGGRTLPLGP